MKLYEDIDTLLEKTRWKEEGWEKRNPFEIIREHQDVWNLMHFSDIGPESHGGFKLGLNPQTDYASTPAGVYGYPITEWLMAHVESNRIPFAGGRDWLYLFRGPFGLFIEEFDDGYGAMSEREAEDNISKLRQKYKVSDDDFEEMSRKGSIMYNDFDRVPVVKLWAITDYISESLSGKKTVQWNKMLRGLGINSVIDDGTSLIHRKEPHQGVVLDTSKIKILDIVPNPMKWKKKRDERESRKELYTQSIDAKESDINWANSVASENNLDEAMDYYMGSNKPIQDIFKGLKRADAIWYHPKNEDHYQGVTVTNAKIENVKIPRNKTTRQKVSHFINNATFDNCTIPGVRRQLPDFRVRGDIKFNNCRFDLPEDHLNHYIKRKLGSTEGFSSKDILFGYLESRTRIAGDDKYKMINCEFRVQGDYISISLVNSEAVKEYSLPNVLSPELDEISSKVGEFLSRNKQISKVQAENLLETIEKYNLKEDILSLSDDSPKLKLSGFNGLVILREMGFSGRTFDWTDDIGVRVGSFNFNDCSFDNCEFIMSANISHATDFKNCTFSGCDVILDFEYGRRLTGLSSYIDKGSSENTFDNTRVIDQNGEVIASI